jgi:hypothetical protein
LQKAKLNDAWRNVEAVDYVKLDDTSSNQLGDKDEREDSCAEGDEPGYGVVVADAAKYKRIGRE